MIVLAALVGLFCLKKFKYTNTRFLIYFLIYVVFIELLGYYPIFAYVDGSMTWIGKLTIGTIFEENFLWYTLFWQIGSAVFLSFYFYKVLRTTLYKKIIRFSIVFYLIFSIIYAVFNYQIFYTDMIKPIWILGLIQSVLCSVLYFLEVLGSDKIMTFYKSVEFYVAAVFFTWLLIRTPLVFYQIYYSSADWHFVFLRRDIILFANLFMYLSFAFALIFCKPEITRDDVFI